MKPSLSENPHFQALLREQGLSIEPSIRSAFVPPDFREIKIGDVRPDGIVVGFSNPPNIPLHFPQALALIYDESKEDQPDALTILECGNLHASF